MAERPELNDLFVAAHVQQPEDSIGFLLWRVAHRYQREIDRALAPFDLTHLQFVLLIQTAWLGRGGDRVTQAGLADFGKIHPMQLSSVLKLLEAKKLVERSRCADRGRGNQVILTPQAVTLLAAAVPPVVVLQRTFFGDDTALNDRLHDALRQVVARWGDDD